MNLLHVLAVTCVMNIVAMMMQTQGAAIEAATATRATSRLSVADDWHSYNELAPDGPGTYAFGYEVDDPATGNVHFRSEHRLPNGTVAGSYGLVAPDGLVHVVHYVADELGYRATTTTTTMATHQQVASSRTTTTTIY